MTLLAKRIGSMIYYMCYRGCSSQMSSPDSGARRILLDGRLLRTIESLALQHSNKFDFARRIIQEFALILAGRLIRYLNVGKRDRAYSHAGIYAPLGTGKDYSWRLIENSGIYKNKLDGRVARGAGFEPARPVRTTGLAGLDSSKRR